MGEHDLLDGVRSEGARARLEREHSTLLLVLHWAHEESARLVTGLRIAGALWRFWYSHGYLSEGRRQLDDLLTVAGDIDALPLPVTAKALRGAAVLAATQGDYARAETLSEVGLGLYHRIGDIRGEAAMLVILGSTSYYVGDYAAARAHYEESLALFRNLGDSKGTVDTLLVLVEAAYGEGNVRTARGLIEEIHVPYQMRR